MASDVPENARYRITFRSPYDYGDEYSIEEPRVSEFGVVRFNNCDGKLKVFTHTQCWITEL